jgi:hypothetical protein
MKKDYIFVIMSKENFLYNGIDLRKATVFDLTANEDFLKRFYSPVLGIKNKEDYLNMGKQNVISRVSDLLAFAEHYKLKPLIESLNVIYKKELTEFFNE